MDATNAASPINYVTGATYEPDNALTGFISGNSSGFAGITNRFFYTPRLQPCRMLAGTGTLPASCADTTTAHAGTLDLTYDFHYGSGNNGNVWAIANNKDNHAQPDVHKGWSISFFRRRQIRTKRTRMERLPRPPASTQKAGQPDRSGWRPSIHYPPQKNQGGP